MAYGTVTVTEAATLIRSSNPRRHSIIVANQGSKTVYLGADKSVTSDSGIPIIVNGSLTEDDGGTRMFMGDIYGICAAGETTDVRYWERER
jgi:hypothetical protein